MTAPFIHLRVHSAYSLLEGAIYLKDLAKWCVKNNMPAVAVAAIQGESGTARLLVLSQVVLSLQLPFAVIPLIVFTSDRRKMGEFASPGWMKVLAWLCAALIVVLNAKLLYDVFVPAA
jgi:manganese transport protein